MRICDIYIEEFGAVNNKKISLLPGFNLIVGENESGKSTLCAFIKFIFYGFADAHEREKYSNFLTKNSAGYLIIETESGGRYRIERRDNPSERSRSRVTVYSEETGAGELFEDWREAAETPGIYFLGVPEKLYGRSVYVSQETGAALDGGSAEAVSNLLLSGDEATNLRRAKNTLDGLRREYRLKRGRGGLIPETEDKLQELREQFRDIQNARTSVEGLNVEIKELEKGKEACRRELNEKRELLLKKRAAVIRKLQNGRDVAKAGMELNRRRRAETLQRESEAWGKDGFIPDEAFISEAEGLEKQISAGEESYVSLEQTLGSQNKNIPKEPAGYDKFRELGTAKIISEYERHRSILNYLKFAFIISLTIAGAGLIAFISAFMGFPASKTATIIVFVIFMLFAGAVFYIRMRYASGVKEFIKSLGASELRTPDIVCRECEEYQSFWDGAAGGARKALEEARKNIDSKKAVLAELLSKTGKKSVSELRKAYSDFLALTADIDREYSELEDRLREYEIRLDAFPEKERTGAMGYTETELREAESCDITEETISAYELKSKRLEEALSNAKLRCAEIIGSGNSEKSLVELSALIDETETKLREYNLKHDAAALAYDMLSEAETSIRQTVSPYLARYAGEYFERLTNGRYSALSLDSEMNLRYRTSRGGTDIDEGRSMDSRYLSGGSADLAWLCLRLALHRKLSDDNRIPVILDECLVYFDDRRLEMILNELRCISENGVQILLLSASSRERSLVCRFANIIELE